MMSSGNQWRLSSESLPGPLGWGVLAVISALIIMVGLNLPGTLGVPVDPGITILAFPVLAFMLYVVWCQERYWVYLAILSHLVIMVDSTPDSIGFGELVFAVLALGGLGVWFVKEMALHRRRIVETGFDLLLVSFIVIGTISSLAACVLHGGDLLQYAKEYVPIFDLLFYFPLKKVTRGREDVIAIIVLFAIVGIVNGTFGFMTYRQRLAAAVFQWQVTASRTNINESTSLALFIMGSTLFAYSSKLWLRAASLALSGAGLVFLLVSFSRSPIVAGVLSVMIMMTLSPWRNGRRVLIAMALALVVGAFVAYLVFPQIITSIGQSLSERIISVAETASDRSFNARLVEAGTILNRYVRYSPLIGVGFGTSFSFLDPLTNTTVTGTFVHNGYIWGLFKFGIPLAILLLWLMIYPIVRLMMIAPSRHEGFNRGLMAAAVGYMLCAFMVHFTSNLFTQVSTILNIVICWTLFDYVQRQVKLHNPKLALLSMSLPARKGGALEA